MKRISGLICLICSLLLIVHSMSPLGVYADGPVNVLDYGASGNGQLRRIS